MSKDKLTGFYRVCVKLYASASPEIVDDASLFVPIFHEWIRDRALDLILLDVADYAHTPDSPGIMLVAQELSFALDRADGRFGLLAQRRVRMAGDAKEAVASTFRYALLVAGRLEGDPRIEGKFRFDASLVRVESNDRLRAPNTDAGFEALSEVVQEAASSVYGGRPVRVSRVKNDPRDRLALEVRIEAAQQVHQHLVA
ncbi:MAG: hypothetical protein EXR92_02575 [Gemmatimonadetes bacterium]|nr:hypothetical protein [Gemmatimonadota bacterium]